MGASSMEKIQVLKKILIAGGCVAILSCTSKKVMEDDEVKFKDINDEYKQMVKVDTVPAGKKGKGLPGPTTITKAPKPGEKEHPVLKPAGHEKTTETTKISETKTHEVVKGHEAKPKVREPNIEDSEGFEGRRPIHDPFRENESVVFNVSYFKVTAGELTMSVGPMKLVNGRKAYSFLANVKTNKTFSMFYTVDDTAETFVDYDMMIPMTYSIDANESSRVKEVRTFFDHDHEEATHWEKVVKKDGQEKKKKINWKIMPFAQNVISAVFYMRNFTLTPGKKFAFRVADDGNNYTFKGDVLRKEKLETDIGELDTVVVSPQFHQDGQFQPTGENLIWLTDDDRKFIVRIESKVKIGTLVAKIKSLEKGH